MKIDIQVLGIVSSPFARLYVPVPLKRRCHLRDGTIRTMMGRADRFRSDRLFPKEALIRGTED